LCKSCRREEWLRANADVIERYMADGHSLRLAIDYARKENDEKINCLACGGFVKDTRSYFCTKTRRCKTARNRLKYLYYKKGVPKELAIRTILTALEKE